MKKKKTKTQLDLEAWEKVEAQILPIVKMNVRAIQRKSPFKIDFDDFVQEGLLEVFMKLEKWNNNRGELKTFVNSILQNKFYTLVQKSLTRSRIPYGFVKIASEWREMPLSPVSNNNMNIASDKIETPQNAVQGLELEVLTNQFKSKIIKSLDERDKKIFGCLVEPSSEFLESIEKSGGDSRNPTIFHIAQFLNLDKNSVSWSIHKIKTLFTKTAKQKEFDDLFGDKIKSNDWPIIHFSFKSGHDYSFVKEVFEKRKLKEEHAKEHHKEKDFCELKNGGTCARWIERYVWGVVLIIKHKDKWATLVLEGKFNPKTGIVKGKRGTRETIPVPWYRELVRELKKGKMK